MAAALTGFKRIANRILDRFDVVKSWRRAGEVVQQHDVRLGRSTRPREIYLSKEEVEDAVKEALLSEEPNDPDLNIYREQEVPA
jgi:hypothetical protein